MESFEGALGSTIESLRMIPRLGPRGIRGLTLAVAAIALLAGCDGDSGADEAPPATAQTEARAAQESPEIPSGPTAGRFTDQGTPGRAVLDTFRYIQLGAIPAAMLQYEASVRRAVGVEDLATALQYQQSTAATFEPQIGRVEDTKAGVMVVLRAKAREGLSPLYTFILRREDDEWLIVYDTFLEGALSSSVTQRVQAGINPRAPEPAARAAAAGVQAASRFRTAGLAP